jgi:hypothetical protein
LEDVQQPGRLPEQNGIVENWRAEWYKEATIRWRTSKDDDTKVEMMRGYPLSLVFWMTPKRRQLSLVLWLNQRVTPQCPK